MLPVSKSVVGIEPASFTNAATAAGTFDCLGFDWAELDVILGRSNDTTNNPSVMNLAQGETTDATNFTNISVGDTAFTVPAMGTDTPTVHRWQVDLRARPRYLKVSVSPVTTQIIAAQARLHRGDETPDDITKSGLGSIHAL